MTDAAPPPGEPWVPVPFTTCTAEPRLCSGITQGSIAMFSLFSASTEVEKPHFQAVPRLVLLFLSLDSLHGVLRRCC